MKKTLAVALVVISAFALGACAKKEVAPAAESAAETVAEVVTEADTEATTEAATEAVTEAQTEATLEEKVYESKDGWQITYQPKLFLMTEDDNGTVNFSYQGDAAGSNVVSISYHPNKMPSEVLYELTGDVGDSEWERSEGWYGGLYPNWSYTRTLSPGEGGSGLGETYIATEHNGGTLIIDIISHRDIDEERSMETSDNISGLLDTLKFTKHEPQQELAYNVGTYVRQYKEEIEGEDIDVTDTVTLNEDHNGTLSFQDDIDIIWSSYEIIGRDTDYREEFKVEGDTLFLKSGDDWLEFERKQ